MVTTVYGDLSDAIIRSASTTFLTAARAPGGSVNVYDTDAALSVGMLGQSNYQINESFIKFDTSGEASASAISLFIKAQGGVETDFVFNVRDHVWNDVLGTGDYVGSDNHASSASLASANTSTFTSDVYAEFVVGAGVLNNNSANSETDFMLVSDEHTNESVPSSSPAENNERQQMYSADGVGTTDDPYIEITGDIADIGGAGFVGPVPVIPPPLMMGY